jgi:aminoglycoside phosphotransferase (APT) family kinase protein
LEPGTRLLPLLRRTCSPDITAVDLEALKEGVVADVYRAQPRLGNGADQAAPLVVKIIHPGSETDSHGRDREANFYAAVHPLLGFERPRVFFAGCDPETRERIVVMEALQGYRNPPRTHRWTPEEARCFVRAFARLHAVPVEAAHVDEPWLFRIRSGEFSNGETLERADDLVRTGAWAPLPNLDRLLGWVAAAGADLESLPESYLHGDVFPPNISLPHVLSGEAVLIDWDMAGIGLAEMDLAFMFLQPFGSAADLDREQVLADYWRERGRLDGAVPSPEEASIRQRYADVLWGLYLIRVAHKSVFYPFPAGSPADSYWESMRGVLHRWLERIGESVK